jgi:hypothetical protein
MITLVEPESFGLRTALLQRLANDMAAMVWMDEHETPAWSCCWIDYYVGDQLWVHCLCNHYVAWTMESNPRGKHCYHWHHRNEPPIVA